MPDDPTPMAEGYYDPWARTAWLLVTSRSLGSDPAYADRATFVDALNDAGINADSSRVSRWESGQHAVSFRALRGYETVLGLPEGALVAANRQLVRDCEASAKPPEKVSFAGHDQRSPDVMVSDLVDRATDKDDHLTGGDWLRLATELERFELVLLSNRTWSLVCERLVHELARTTGVDQLRRFEALSTLVTHPVAQRHVLLALGAWLTDPDATSSANRSRETLAMPFPSRYNTGAWFTSSTPSSTCNPFIRRTSASTEQPEAPAARSSTATKMNWPYRRSRAVVSGTS
mgnify:CR=1 FL=1